MRDPLELDQPLQTDAIYDVIMAAVAALKLACLN